MEFRGILGASLGIRQLQVVCRSLHLKKKTWGGETKDKCV